jgi:Tfp pilus assembly protein PilO
MIRFIVAILGFCIAIAVFVFYTRPAYDQVGGLQKEIADYNQALEKAAELQQLKQALLSRYNSFNPEDLSRLAKLLPDHVDNVRLILDLDSLASRHGFTLENVVISGSSQSDASRSSASATIGASAQAYDSLTFRFGTQGTYDDFVVFMEDLERSLRIVDLVSLNLSRVPLPTGVVTAEPYYQYDVVIRTYWLK